MFTSTRVLSVLLIALLPATVAVAEDPHEHEDVTVGQDGAGSLMAEFDWAEVHQLPAVSGLLNGWAGDDPGFAHLEMDEPGESFYMLAAGADIYLEVVSFDAALRGNPLTDDISAIGEQAYLGDEELHAHVDWFIDSDAADFDPLQTVWEAQFKLIDLGATAYGDSPVYTLQFTNVPEPTSVAILALGMGLAGVRRQRRR